MRRTLTVGGLSLALLAVAASTASAGSISPASSNFGRVLIGKTSAPRTFTFVKGSEPEFELQPNGPSFVTNDVGDGFSQTHDTQTSPNCPAVLTASHPSCTIGVYFSPETPGPNRGEIFANYLSPDPIAPLTGIGLLSRKSYFCRKQGGHFVIHKKITKYCQK
jgi:hypothetical protein